MRRDGRPTCYLHIGPHKTGSSSIQHFVRANAGLLERHGLVFPLLPDEKGRPVKNHISLLRSVEIRRNGALKPKAELWPHIDRVARRGEHDILLSSEMFCRALSDADMLGRVLTFFETRGYQVVVIGYVRDQPGWLNSWYVQHQKHFTARMSFDAFAEDFWKSGRLDPWRYLEPFLGDGRFGLVVVPFEAAARAGLELDFISRLGVPTDLAFERPGLINVNVGAKSVFAAQEIIRRAGPDLRSRPTYGAAYRAFKQRCLALRWNRDPYVAIDDAVAARIRERYRGINESFAAAHLGASWTELCLPRSHAPSVFDPSRATPRELAEIETLVTSICSRLNEPGASDASAAEPRRAVARRAAI